MSTETLPTPAVRNSIAFVDFFGNFARGTHVSTRLAAQRFEDGEYVWVQFVRDMPLYSLRFYSVTDAGRAVAARGALSKTLAWLAAEGFKFQGTRSGKTPKMGFLDGFAHEDGRTAWISNSQSDTSSIYINYPRAHPNYTVGSQLTFTAKAN